MNENINSILLQSILQQLSLKGFTEKECTQNIGVSSSFFSDWKAGRLKSPSFDKIYRISSYLNVPIDVLLSDDNKNTATKTDVANAKLAVDERSLLNIYRELDDDLKIKALDLLRKMWADYNVSTKNNQPKGKLYPSPKDELIG